MKAPVAEGDNFSIQNSDQEQLLGSKGVKPEVGGGINPSNDNYVSLENSGAAHIVYKRRWYILILFGLLNSWQCVTWNTWGPIADTSKLVLNWTDGDIALLTNWGPITYLGSGLLFSWVLDTKGLKISVIMSGFFLFIGLGARCLPVGITFVKWTMNAGQILIGFAAPLLNAAPTILSAAWFPPHQRTTATAISTTSIYLGFAMSFLIGPQIVTDVESVNQTIIPGDMSVTEIDLGDSLDPDFRVIHFQEIMLLMYIEFGVGAALALCTIIYFPDKPPTPPSASAATTRVNFKEGALLLVKNAQFWILGLAYSISSGVYSSWVTQLDSLFQDADGVNQDTAGWIGFYTNIAGMLGGLILARCVDRFGGYMKQVLLVLATLATGSCLWCVLLSLKFIQFHLVYLYISCILFGFFISASVPIYFEITVEGVYPIAEGITTMVLTLMNNGTGLIFLLFPLIPWIGVDWMNWAVLIASGVAVPFLLMYRASYNRMKQDKDEVTTDVSIQGITTDVSIQGI